MASFTDVQYWDSAWKNIGVYYIVKELVFYETRYFKNWKTPHFFVGEHALGLEFVYKESVITNGHIGQSAIWLFFEKFGDIDCKSSWQRCRQFEETDISWRKIKTSFEKLKESDKNANLFP